MKLVYALLFASFVTLTAQAQPDIDLSITLPPFPSTSLPDGGSQTSPFPIPYGVTQTFTFTIRNTGTSDLTLSQTGGVYIVLSGTAQNEVDLNESAITPVIAAGGSTSFTITNKATTAPGSYSLNLFLANNDPDAESPYTGTVNYTIATATSVISAKEIGMTLSPSPSTDGQMTISANNVAVSKVIVYNAAGAKEEFNGSLSFHTKQKGLLVVHVYTDKGVVVEKIIVQ